MTSTSRKTPPVSSDADQVTDELAAKYPNRWKALWVLACGLALIVIDGTIVGVALPDIISKLNLDLTNAQWVNSLYSVVFAALLLSTGRLADRIGRRKVFFVGIVVFASGSVVAALSHGVAQLIWARVIQGVGGAMILPSTLSTVNAIFRGKQRAAAFGVWGAVMSGAAALGPLLGGWLTSSFSWEWIFWVNVPIAVAVFIAGVLFVPETRGDSSRRGVDVDGLLLSAIGFGFLVFGIIEGPKLGWWKMIGDFHIGSWKWSAALSPVPFALAIGVVGLVLFVLWERHRAGNGRDAILALGLFKLPTFTWGNVAAFAVAVGEFGIVFVLPLYLVNARGLSVMDAGWILSAMALGAFGSGAAARHLAAAVGATNTVIIGLALEVIGVVTVAMAIEKSPLLVCALLVIYGLGLGLASAQLTSTVLKDVPQAESGQGSATQSTVRQVGAAVGAAVAGAVLSGALAQTLPKAVEDAGLHAPQQLVDAVRMSAGGALHGLDGQPLGEALAHGFATAVGCSLYAAAVFLLLGFFAAFMVRASDKKHQQTVGADAEVAAKN
ncbi:DHA2 family efflux MFS transporter permease subunit [Corynebacterium aquilae]|uniref:Multidrug transporter n=1 Tax=Corynebacterium aquilae DSM 44791 TaxID=1431546 RepID=A0A1L7CDA2_9CORY|nr:DHA2 family efflux MFS transporter permease subunit [Corynebacterium aquilae]APT83816.1 multidrug transporter [Corynebacterium aquilae DSM 44791]